MRLTLPYSDFTLNGYNSKRLRLIIRTMQKEVIKLRKIIEERENGTKRD